MSANRLASLRSVPLSAWPGEVAWRLRRRLWRARGGAKPGACTYSGPGSRGPERLFQDPADALAARPGPSLASWCTRYLAHEFDLLGSGWTSFRLDERVAPLRARVNFGNAARAAEIAALLDANYAPIDWQRDVGSGQRWSESTWHRDLRAGAGVEIKLPWELARLQHLPQLALGAAAGHLSPAHTAREIRNQMLDFVSANPPGWGVNWGNAMEAAIRAVNLLVARDLLSAAGQELDTAAHTVLRASIVDHGRFIAENLEWHPRLRGNHYLANLAGLAFCGAALEGEEADRWLAFALDGVAFETARQFHRDGGHFEASACYHRLCAEIAAGATALALALPSERIERLKGLRPRMLSPQHGLRTRALMADPLSACAHCGVLRRAARFTKWLTKPDHRVAQIGDNDSGRFLKLAWNERDGREDFLDHRPLAAAIAACAGELADADPDPGAGDWEHAQGELAGSAGAARRERRLASGPGLTDGLRCAAFPDFGLYVLHSRRIWLSVRCGESGIAPHGGHAHNDQLALELMLDGVPLVRDPGSYVYTRDPASRNAYRSAAAHDAPRIEGLEPAALGEDLFRLDSRTGARCLYFGPRGFVGSHRGYGAPVWRIVALTDDALVVDDRSLAGPLADPAPPPFSPGYGICER